MGQYQSLRFDETRIAGEEGDPIREASLDRLLGEPLETRETGYQMPVDLIDRVDHVMVYADLPGLDWKDVAVCLAGRVLTIEALYAKAGEEKGRVFFKERSSGRLQRSIVLPTGLDTSRYEASLENGLLKVRVPKLKH